MKKKPVIIEFPMRGEWQAPTSPVKKIPSHGTNRMGMRYAYDFLQIDWDTNKRPFQKISALRYLLFGAPLEKYMCWGKDIFAPCDGEIVAVVDGISERKKAHWLVDLAIGIKNSRTFNEQKDSFSVIAGNYIVMKNSDDIYLLFAHLQTNTSTVSVHDLVKKGDFLGKIGHSGNSTSPHLHFQLMDRADIANAKGIPFLFECYELYQEGTWKTVYNQLPSSTDRFRFRKNSSQEINSLI